MVANIHISAYYRNFAQYGCSSYGFDSYGIDGSSLCSAASDNAATGGTNLVDTGQMVVPSMLIGCLCILASLYIVFSKRLKSRKSKAAE